MRYVTFILLLASLTSCRMRSHQSNNPEKRYSRSSHPINAAISIYHTSDDSSTIHFRILSTDLLYTRRNQGSPFTANYSIHYAIFDPASKLIRDSSTVNLKDVRNSDESSIIQGSIPFLFRKNTIGRIKVVVIDKNRQSREIILSGVDKKSPYNLQNFVIENPMNQEILVTNIIRSDKPIRIKSHRYNPGQLYMKYYRPAELLPPPPFSSIKNSIKVPFPDTILPKPFNGHMDISLDKRGIYRFTDDTLSGNGFTLLRFSDKFPRVSTPEMLYQPLRYLTSSDEFAELENAEDKKAAVDKFWIDMAGSKEIARKLIKAYYGRVEDANTYFSTYQEGWQTDRGLIYIIFGPPERVLVPNGKEVWFYGNEAVTPGLSFTFTYVENELSDNVFELERSINYKSMWYRALDTWRSGRIYTAR